MAHKQVTMAKAIEYGYPIGRLMEALIIDRYEFVSVDEDAVTVRLVEPETAIESIETTLTESGVIKPTAHMEGWYELDCDEGMLRVTIENSGATFTFFCLDE